MMALTPGNRSAQSDSIPVILVDMDAAQRAYLIYAQMKRDEVREPALIDLPLWNAMKLFSYQIFLRHFQVKP